MSNLTSRTDHELVVLYEEGNDQAFDTLLARHQERIFNYILRLVPDENSANDVFQDTFIKAIMSIRNHQYQSTGKFSAWLTRIAHNVVIDRIRGDKFASGMDDEEQFQMIHNNIQLSEEACEERLVRDANVQVLDALVRHLPAAQREIVHLRFYEDMPFKDIAQVTGVSINTALGRMRYALINLRRIANQYSLDIAV